jgi:acetamidase/formamidase
MMHKLAASVDTVRAGVFNAAFPPVLTVKSGDTVEIQTVSGRKDVIPAESQGFFVPPALREILAANADYPGVHLMTGPVSIEGAEPGDVLEVRIERVVAGADWGFTYMRPLAGVLQDEYKTFTLFHTRVDEARGKAITPWGSELDFRPFLGVMAVAPPPEYAMLASKEPRIHGGNMDVKDLTQGSTLYLPVHVPGANFVAGDGHGLQGDGEVCVTALEMCLTGTFTFVVHKRSGEEREEPFYPRAETPTHLISMGFHESLDEALKLALRNMIAFIRERSGLSGPEAYALCSLATDFHISQAVNGEKGVHGTLAKAYLP